MMSTVITPSMLLAQATGTGGELPMPLRAVRDHWGDSTISVGWVILSGSVLLFILAIVWVWNWWKQRNEQPRPWWVFYRTASHMGLTLREQWLLVRIARHERLPSPLTLMLSRRTLGHHARQYLARRSQHRRAAIIRRLLAIRSALFDSLESSAATPVHERRLSDAP
ncbi:hypothetical protein ACERK3_05225 [Phycisphaerales bacterium AB-hyl4]|uniref:Uncharacterized protein n=1 Tax=Natronomicrosphaera hydrolytica TaxID=3242702 RepID=A0ABV4U460_9BACT